MAIGPIRPARLRGPFLAASPDRVRRLGFVNAPPRVVWTALHDASHAPVLFPELRLGPATPAWPAAATVRTSSARLGLLHDDALVESLEARPMRTFRLRVTGRAFDSWWTWCLEPRAGGTRVLHDATLQPGDLIAEWLIRLGRDSLTERVEAHLRALKDIAEAAGRDRSAASSRPPS